MARMATDVKVGESVKFWKTVNTWFGSFQIEWIFISYLKSSSMTEDDLIKISYKDGEELVAKYLKKKFDIADSIFQSFTKYDKEERNFLSEWEKNLTWMIDFEINSNQYVKHTFKFIRPKTNYPENKEKGFSDRDPPRSYQERPNYNQFTRDKGYTSSNNYNAPYRENNYRSEKNFISRPFEMQPKFRNNDWNNRDFKSFSYNNQRNFPFPNNQTWKNYGGPGPEAPSNFWNYKQGREETEKYQRGEDYYTRPSSSTFTKAFKEY